MKITVTKIAFREDFEDGVMANYSYKQDDGGEGHGGVSFTTKARDDKTRLSLVETYILDDLRVKLGECQIEFGNG